MFTFEFNHFILSKLMPLGTVDAELVALVYFVTTIEAATMKLIK